MQQSVVVPVNNYTITQGFQNFNPKFYGPQFHFRHPGIDLVGEKEIRAALPGKVVCARPLGGWGNLIKIDCGGGREMWYAHNSKLLVKEGDVVETGATISIMGTTGYSTGVHCHFRLLVNGRETDPKPYIRRVTIGSEEINKNYMWTFEESVELGHQLMLGRGATDDEKARWYAMEKSRATIDAMMKDLARNTMDNGSPTYRKHALNAAAFYVRGFDLVDSEVDGLQDPGAYLAKATTGMILAQDLKTGNTKLVGK